MSILCLQKLLTNEKKFRGFINFTCDTSQVKLQATTKLIKTDASFSRHSLIIPGENTLSIYTVYTHEKICKTGT